MDSLLSRHRNAVVLVAVLFLQLVLLAFQVKRDQDVPLIRIWAVAVITPVEKASSSVIRGLVGLWRDYVDLRQARQENRHLIEEIGRLKLVHHRLQEEAREAHRLKELLQLSSPVPFSAVAAWVIGSSASETSRVLFLDKGSEVGIQPNMPVITPDGIVGKVHRVFWGSARVLVITDPDSGVGALLEKSRVHGVLQGSGGFFCQLAYVVNDERVEVGEHVLTSGEDLIYPKGLPIGVVTSVRPGPVFRQIRIRPSARLNRLEEVLVIVHGTGQKIRSRPESAAVATSSPRKPGSVVVAATLPTPPATNAGPRAAETTRIRPETDGDKLLRAYRAARADPGRGRKRAVRTPQRPVPIPAVSPQPTDAPPPAASRAEVEGVASAASPRSQPAITTVPEDPPDPDRQSRPEAPSRQ